MGDAGLGEFTYQSTPNAVTAFLAKLCALVNDATCNDLITWDASGKSFHVYDQARFAREVLPRYFKHNNFASFIRQLNMYGFRKVSTIEHGSLKNERDDIEFSHSYFVQGQEAMLELIKRRAPDHQQQQQQKSTVVTTKIDPCPLPTPPSPAPVLVAKHPAETQPAAPLEFSNLLDDVRNLQSKQTGLTDKLFHLQDENQALWREIGSLRQRHSKQQQIVSKLLEFLMLILTNSTQSLRRSVEPPLSNQTPHDRSQLDRSNLEPLSNLHGLKRKPAALMHTEEPNKRTAMQQKPQHQLLSSIDQSQQRITINELTDHESGGWPHTTNASPLVDLVPSPPSSTGDARSSYELPTPADVMLNSLNFTGNNNNNNRRFSLLDYVHDELLTSPFLNSDPHDSDYLADANLSDLDTVNFDADYHFDMI